MTAPAAPRLLVVVIAGPQASGKSTVSTALARTLRSGGETVALVALDDVAAMALPTLPDWAVAHGIFESVVGEWARAGCSCVVAEGSGTAAEVRRLLVQVPDGGAVLTVALTAPLEVAFERAQADPSRGLSRDRGFLTGVYEQWGSEVHRLEPDLMLATEGMSVEQCVDAIREAAGAARRTADSARA